MRTTLLFSSLAQKRAGVGVGFRSVLMSAMTDLNLCTHKLPKNFLCRGLQAKLSEWQIKLLNQQILHARDVDRPLPESIDACTRVPGTRVNGKALILISSSSPIDD